MAVLCLLPQAAYAGTGTVTTSAAGATPFIANLTASYSGGTLESIAYGILPKPGSLTRPLIASCSPQYLISVGDLNTSTGKATIPVFGLYAGYSNSVYVYFYFTDGSVSVQIVNVATAGYSDPCTAINSPTFTQNRVNQSDLNYDFFILKEDCSANNPTIVDTDGDIRWVGQANEAVSAVSIYNNEIYLSDGKAGILGMPLTTATPTTIGTYSAAPYNVTFTGHHNIDPGRNGLIVDVNTTTQTEAVDLEFNPTTGAVENYWDLGQILTYTMNKGGDNPANFVLGTTADWFHNNAVAYNPADNTLIVSSRENFVVAVDYDTPSDGQKKIHWILGDTSKAWYQYASLRALMLTPTNAATLPPIGQHAVSIDHLGNLLLFDDGFQSLTQSPTGNSRTYSAVREYQISDSAMTATQGPIYYSPNPTVFNPICGSVYDVNNTLLVDFPTDGDSTSNLGGPSTALLQGLGSSENIVFNLQYQQPAGCDVGWNAYPLPSNVFSFTAAATTPVAQTITFNPIPAQYVGGTLTVSATASSGLTVTFSLVPNGNCSISGNTVTFLNTGNCGVIANQAGNSTYAAAPTVGQIVVVNNPPTQRSQTITFNPIPAGHPGTSVTVKAVASSGLPVSFVIVQNGNCSISGNVVTLLNAGNCGVVATQTGNSQYAAAPAVGQIIVVY